MIHEIWHNQDGDNPPRDEFPGLPFAELVANVASSMQSLRPDNVVLTFDQWHNQDGNNQGNPVLARSLTAAELFPDPAEDEESSEDERIMHENIDVQARMDLVINNHENNNSEQQPGLTHTEWLAGGGGPNNPPLARSLTAAELFPDPVRECIFCASPADNQWYFLIGCGVGDDTCLPCMKELYLRCTECQSFLQKGDVIHSDPTECHTHNWQEFSGWDDEEEEADDRDDNNMNVNNYDDMEEDPTN